MHRSPPDRATASRNSATPRTASGAPWAPGEHGHWIRLVPKAITGRRIVPGQLPPLLALLGVRSVAARPGLTVGLEHLLDL